MANMYPAEGPSEDCQSRAEQNLYHLLRNALGPDWYVIHSVQWNTVGPNDKMQPGEADFIVINRERGIAVIEVKGGRVVQNDKRWYSIDAYNNRHHIKNPFTQALTSAKVLERKLNSVSTTKPFFAENYKDRICPGVWFPDILWPRDGRGEMQKLDQQVLDKADATKKNVSDALLRLFDNCLGTAPARPISNDAIHALIDLLVPDFSTIDSPLGDEMSLDESVIAHLTMEQVSSIMAMWKRHVQMAIPGYAGTGKTVIALEMAWRLAKTGDRALFLCANNTLAAHLRQRVQASPRSRNPGFDLDDFQIRSVEELVEHIAELAKGIVGEKRAHVTELKQLSVTIATDQEKMATFTSANLDLLARKAQLPVYDALLVDEAQDINQPLWPVLRRLLRESDDADKPAATCFYVFFDPAQRDLSGEWDPAWTGIDTIHPPLIVNCRNTEVIYGVMGAFNPLLRDIPFRGPVGRPVIYRDPATQAPNAAGDPVTATLDAVLTDLIDVQKQKVRPEQILVITGRSISGQSKRPTRWRLSAQQQLGNHRLELLHATRSATRIALTTIRSSKGLESPVVILAELDGIAQDGLRDRLLYTAVSRAKHQLIVLGPPTELQPARPGRWQRFFGRGLTNQGLPQRVAHMPPAQIPDDDAFIGPDDPDDTPQTLVSDRLPDGSDGFDAPDSQTAPQPIPTSVPAPAHMQAPPKGQNKQKKQPVKQPPGQVSAPPAGKQAAASKTFQPSSYQQKIFEFVRNGTGNAIVRAVAGSGKTTTLVEAAKLINSRNSLFLAFNNHTAKSMGQRLRGAPMSARTIHSTGLQTLKRFWVGDPEPTVDPNKYMRISQDWARDNLAHIDQPSQQQAAEALKQLADFTRATLTDPSDAAALRLMAAHFGIACDVVPLDQVIQAIPDVLARGDELARSAGENENDRVADDSASHSTHHIIDYMDMVYLPHAWKLPGRWQADWVFVDDAQDLNAAQLALALKCCGPKGRLLFVGDPHQAIYGFSGADSDTFQRIQQKASTTKFELPVCYRCPISHIKLASEFAPEMKPRPGAPEGIVTETPLSAVAQMVHKGDLILSRKTAPLIDLSIMLLHRGISARVRGHDIGARLMRLVQEVTHLPDFEWQRFERWLDAYERQQSVTIQQAAQNGRTNQLSQAGSVEAELIRLRDRVAGVRVCYQKLQANDAADLCMKIDALFRDEQPDVILSTAYHAKGLEANRVFLLDPDEMPLRWPDQQEWEMQQERNIKYVALTRAKRELYLVRKASS